MKLDLPVFITYHVGYFLLTTILCFLIPGFIVAFFIAEEIQAEAFTGTLSGWLSGVLGGSTRISFLILVLVIFTIIVLINLNRQYVTCIERIDDKILIHKSSRRGKVNKIDIPLSSLKLKVITYKKKPVVLNIERGYDRVARISAYHKCWERNASRTIKKVIELLPNTPIQFFTRDELK